MIKNVGSKSYEAEIRWTEYEVPHIKAGSFGGLGFGQAYAIAHHHYETIFDQIVKVNSMRSLVLGKSNQSLTSDFAYLALDLSKRAEQLFEVQPNYVKEFLSGYACGLNEWYKNHGDDGLSGFGKGRNLRREIEAVDICKCAIDIATAASARNLVSFIAECGPPGPDGPLPTPSLDAMAPHFASNGWGIGRKFTDDGNSIIVGNPHFPWYGEARFYENHLTIPGVLNVYGASLLGLPGIQIGFNDNVAWTHTFSIGKRLVFYKLNLVEGVPTSYFYDDEIRDMKSIDHEVKYLNDTGDECIEVRTLWKSHYGPILNLPLIGWSESFAVSFHDANEHNYSLLTQWLDMSQASSLSNFIKVFENVNGVPWATTVAGDSSGEIWFCDASKTPNFSKLAIEKYNNSLLNDPIAKLFDQNRVAFVDGSNSVFELEISQDGSSAIPFAELPQLSTDSWIINCNDSHFLVNTDLPLTGYSPLVGPEYFDPSPRARANYFGILDRSEISTDSGLASRSTGETSDNYGYSPESLFNRLLSNISTQGVILREDIVENLNQYLSNCEDLDIKKVVKVLTEWDLKYDLDSRGAHLFREILAYYSDSDLKSVGKLFTNKFDRLKPTRTPNTFPVEFRDELVNATKQAIEVLKDACIEVDARLGDVQFVMRRGKRVPVHGGQEYEGIANIVTPVGLLSGHSTEPSVEPLTPTSRSAKTGLGKGGYQVNYGTSFIMIVELTPNGPKGIGLLVYGQVGDRESLNYMDQLDLYNSKVFRELKFAEDSILGDSSLRIEAVSNVHLC